MVLNHVRPFTRGTAVALSETNDGLIVLTSLTNGGQVEQLAAGQLVGRFAD
jgi:hypothetical protein